VLNYLKPSRSGQRGHALN